MQDLKKAYQSAIDESKIPSLPNEQRQDVSMFSLVECMRLLTLMHSKDTNSNVYLYIINVSGISIAVVAHCMLCSFLTSASLFDSNPVYFAELSSQLDSSFVDRATFHLGFEQHLQASAACKQRQLLGSALRFGNKQVVHLVH